VTGVPSSIERWPRFPGSSEEWKNIASDPSPGVINPNPRASKNLTVPSRMVPSFFRSFECRFD